MTTEQSPTILIIDDEPAIGIPLKRLAEAAFPDFQVLWVARGATGITQVRMLGRALRLVVLDIQMPAYDGRLAAAQIRALAPHVPILPFTSFAEKAAALRELGCLEPVMKGPGIMARMPERMRAAMATPGTPAPSGVLAETLQQIGEGLAAEHPLEVQVARACVLLDQYRRRFPQPAREVVKAQRVLAAQTAEAECIS